MGKLRSYRLADMWIGDYFLDIEADDIVSWLGVRFFPGDNFLCLYLNTNRGLIVPLPR
jgi:hypothetical protein